MAAWDVPTIKQNMNLNITWVLTFAYLWGCVHVFVFFVSTLHYSTQLLIFVCMCVGVYMCFTFCLCVYRRLFMGEYVSVYIFLYLWMYLFMLMYLCLWVYMCLFILLQWDKMLIRRISRLLNKCEKEQEKTAQDIQWDSCLLFDARVTLYVSYFGANSTDPERWDLKAQCILVGERGLVR